MLELGKKYTTTEFYQAANISKRAWETRREDVLNHIGTFYEFTIIPSGRYIIYHITGILKEPYTNLPTKRDMEKIKAFYKEKTHNIVDNDPWNTGANVARRIVADDNKFNHAPATAANYVRPVIREDYHREETRWMRCNYILNRYEALTEEQEEYLKECFSKFSDKAILEHNINLYAEMRSGYLTPEEASEQMLSNVGCMFDKAMSQFMIKYDFRPIRVSKLVEGKALTF